VRILGKTAFTAALAGVMGLGLTFGGAVTAHAATTTILSGAGSDTTYFMMAGSSLNPNGLDKAFNASHPTIKVTEIPPSNSTATGFPASVKVPADAACPKVSPWNSDGSYTWDSHDAAHTPPNGSGAGITALQNDDASAHKGCLVDFARSSRALGSSTDTPDLQSFAYALDAVTWSTDAAANPADPTTLTTTQLTKIYTCFTSGPNVGKPQISNWSQVNGGGTSSAIVKYAPQSGSGTLSFFQTKLLGGATVDAGCDAAHLSHRAEENQLTTRCTNNDVACAQGTQAIPAADYAHLIVPFSYSKWHSQFNGSEPDLRHGAAIKAVGGVTPSATTIKEGAGHFIGTRYVYNILTPKELRYAATAVYAGINQTSKANGFICQDASAANHTTVANIIRKFGFTPLVDAVEGSGQPKGYCRFNPTPL
jgi:phosphate transport system substrate-binding protein